MLCAATSTGHEPAQHEQSLHEHTRLSPRRDKGSHGRGRQAAGAAAAPPGAARGKEGREQLYSKPCLCSHSLSATTDTACKQPYGPNQAGDSSFLPAIVEVSVSQSNSTLAVPILLLTSNILPGLSAKLYMFPLVLWNQSEQGLPVSSSMLVNRSRKPGGVCVPECWVSANLLS